jgi:steroid delta-isomerase
VEAWRASPAPTVAWPPPSEEEHVVDRSAICETCDRYIASVSAGDVDAVMSLYADDTRVEDPVGSDPLGGRDAVRGFYEKNAQFTFSAQRIGPVTVVGDRAAFQFRIDVPLGDTTLKMTSTDIMTFDGTGRILTMVAYADGEADPDAPI